jgi:hypothetical protein
MATTHAPSPSPVDDHQDSQAATPVVRTAAGETRIIITQRSGAAVASRASTFESTDYSYVLKDLRRVSLVTGTLVVVLIVLSLVIH